MHSPGGALPERVIPDLGIEGLGKAKEQGGHSRLSSSAHKGRDTKEHCECRDSDSTELDTRHEKTKGKN